MNHIHIYVFLCSHFLGVIFLYTVQSNTNFFCTRSDQIQIFFVHGPIKYKFFLYTVRSNTNFFSTRPDQIQIFLYMVRSNTNFFCTWSNQIQIFFVHSPIWSIGGTVTGTTSLDRVDRRQMEIKRSSKTTTPSDAV